MKSMLLSPKDHSLFQMSLQVSVPLDSTLNSRLLQAYVSLDSNCNMRLLQIDFSFDSILSALNSECHELCSFLFALKSPIASSDNINYHLCLKIFCTFNQVMKNVVKTCVDYLLLVLSTSLDPNFDRDNPFAT